MQSAYFSICHGLLQSVPFCIQLRPLQSKTFLICPRSVAVCVILHLPSVGYSLHLSASVLGLLLSVPFCTHLRLLQSATLCTCPRSVVVYVYRHLYPIRCCLCNFASTSLRCCLRLSVSVRACVFGIGFTLFLYFLVNHSQSA